MRQLLIISDSDPRTTTLGGVASYTKHLAARAVNNYEVTIIGKKTKGEPQAANYKVLLATNKVGANNITYFKGLMQQSKKNIPADIIHSQRPDWLVPFRHYKAKKIVTLHGSHTKNMKLKKSPLLVKTYQYLEKKGLSYTDTIIAVDHQTLKEYQQKYPQYQHKMIWIPVGVDTKLFNLKNKQQIKKQLGIPQNKKILLYVGRLSKEKNIDRMISLVQQNELLIIAGEGSLRTQLEKQAKNKPVIFTGSLGQEQLSDYYSAADVLLLFSEHEGLPTVVLEALSSGLPIVATPVGELPLLINEKIGVITTKNYREAIEKVTKKNSTMRNACRKRAQEYDWTAVVTKILEVYE